MLKILPRGLGTFSKPGKPNPRNLFFFVTFSKISKEHLYFKKSTPQRSPWLPQVALKGKNVDFP